MKKQSEKATIDGAPALTGPAGTAPGQRLYLCIGPNCWGRGTTAAEAVKNAKKNYSRSISGAWKWLLYDVQHDATIDDMGSICYVPINPDDYAASAEHAYKQIARFEPNKK